MNKFPFLLILIAGAWQIISLIIQSAEKRKKQEREMELANKRRQVGQAYQTQQMSSSGPVNQPPGNTGQLRSRAEELAARRQAQLEELRRRRAGKSSSSQPQTQIRLGGPASTPVSQSPMVLPARQPSQIRSRQADLESIHRQQEMERRQKVEQERINKQQVKAADEAEARRDAIEESRVRADRDRFHRKVESGLGNPLQDLNSDDIHSRQKLKLKAVNRLAVKGRLRDPETLRELFVLKELLDPPLGLRDMEL